MRVFYVGFPIVGHLIGFVAIVYQVWLLIAGGKAVHEMDSTGAGMAVLLPVAVMGLFSFLAAIMAGVGVLAFLMYPGGT